MLIKFILKRIIYLLYKINYFGKFNFINIDILKNHKGPAILISNHSYAIDLYIPIILNTILKRKVYTLAAAYPFTSKFKMCVAKKLGIIFVTKRLSIDELTFIAKNLNVETNDNQIKEAYKYYNNLADKYNLKAKKKIEEVLMSNHIIYSFAQYHQPFFAMEKGSFGLGKMILSYSKIPVFPISIVDISNPPVEFRTRNQMNNLKRIDLLTDKRRKKFSGIVNIIFNKPIIVKNIKNNNPQFIIDEILAYLGNNIPSELLGYYKNKEIKKGFKYHNFYKEE